MTVAVAYSPCPNDTYLFYGWVHSKIGVPPPDEVRLGDIQHLNEWAKREYFPLIKVSYALLPQIQDKYVVLPVGSALGRACGPKLIANRPFPLSDLPTKRVAIPGALTTAHHLYSALMPNAVKQFCTYDQAPMLLKEGVVDAAVIIHEQRFTFTQEGFVELADLGQLWEAKYAAPIPLGCIVAHRSIGREKHLELADTLRASLQYAQSHPELTHPYVMAHSQVKDRSVVQSHIDTYISDETLSLSVDGKKAVELFVHLKPNWLLQP